MSGPVANEILLQQLRWRYAVKRFDRTRKIAPADWTTLEEALVLSPSSYGVQPWKFVVVTEQATKEKLQPLSYNQQQVVDGSHVVVFCIRKPLKVEDVDDRFFDKPYYVTPGPGGDRAYVLLDRLRRRAKHPAKEPELAESALAGGR